MCADSCAELGWDRWYFIDSDSCGCKFGPYEGVPWAHFSADTSWRYVVVVRCAYEERPWDWCDTTTTGTCFEQHRLFRCKMNPTWPT